MLKNLFVALAVVLVFTPTEAVAHKAVQTVDTAESLIEAAATNLQRSDQSELPSVLLSYVETGAIARFTLGSHAKRLSDASLTRYTAAFEGWLHSQVENQAHRLGGFGLSVENVAYRNRNDAIVTTQVRKGSDSVKLRWRVIRRGGSWGVVDLEFAGVWLAIEQRAQVDAILDRPGATIDEVIARLG